MSKLINKRNNLKIHQPPSLQLQSIQSKSHNIINQRVLSLLYLEEKKIALVQSSFIVIMDINTSQTLGRIELQFQVCKIAFSRNYQQFIILPKCQDLNACSLVTVSAKSYIFNSYYKYQENKIGNKEREWQSWLKFFQQSQRVVLIRKFYGYSLCCIFEQTPHLVKSHEFRINQECISKLDEDKYMVNFRQVINKYSLIVEIVNTQTNKKSQYKIIQLITPNTTKSVKLWKKDKESTSKGDAVSLTVVIAMNTKFQGYSLMIVKFLEDSNLYNILGVISMSKYEIYKLLPLQIDSQEFMTLQYRYDEPNRKVHFVLANYRIGQISHEFSQTSHKIIQSPFIGMAFNLQTKQLTFYESIFELGQDHQIQSHSLLLNRYKKIHKEILYASLLDHLRCKKSISQQILNLLA